MPQHETEKRWAYERRRFCSLRCVKLGRPSPKRGKKYRDNAKRIPCRICGAPTERFGTEKSSDYGLYHCGSPECREKSKLQKNEAIRETHLTDYALGKRAKVRHAWAKVPRVSVDELLLKPWFDVRGWTSQFKCVPGGISSVRLPRCFWLDFALLDRRLYVEIDGSVHRLRKERDARKDQILSDRGWKGLRVPASLVRSDLTATIAMIEAWLSH